LGALATIRPDSWNLPLFLHVLGAMVAMGGVALAFVYLTLAWRGDSPAMLRAGYRALLYGALPGYLVMRVGAQWVYSKEGLDSLPTDPSWVGTGFAVADGGLLLLLIATITCGVGNRRSRAGGGDVAGPTTGIRVATVLAGIVLVAYVIAIWAMTTKPT
jgi:hypothetical protein